MIIDCAMTTGTFHIEPNLWAEVGDRSGDHRRLLG